jgi:hypothetical protein
MLLSPLIPHAPFFVFGAHPPPTRFRPSSSALCVLCFSSIPLSQILSSTNSIGHISLALVRLARLSRQKSSGLFGGVPGIAVPFSVPMRLKNWIRGKARPASATLWSRYCPCHHFKVECLYICAWSAKCIGHAAGGRTDVQSSATKTGKPGCSESGGPKGGARR